MPLEPRLIARGWVRQRQITWCVFPPCCRGLCERCLSPGAEKVPLRVVTDQDGELDARQFCEKMVEPQSRAFAPRWQVAAATNPGPP